MKTSMDHTIRIADNGRVEELTYEGLMVVHNGDAIWGASVGFRALQVADQALSKERVWDRANLSIVSAHPGPGVRDAMEYVTRCVSRNRYRLLDPSHQNTCHAGMAFRWWIMHQGNTVDIELREGFVPKEFFELLDRRGTDWEQPDDEDHLATIKSQLTAQLWETPLEDLFLVRFGECSTILEGMSCTS